MDADQIPSYSRGVGFSCYVWRVVYVICMDIIQVGTVTIKLKEKCSTIPSDLSKMETPDLDNTV